MFFYDSFLEGIHSTCVIDSDSKISGDILVGTFSFIGKAKIGKSTVISSNVRTVEPSKATDIAIVAFGLAYKKHP